MLSGPVGLVASDPSSNVCIPRVMMSRVAVGVGSLVACFVLGCVLVFSD